MKTGPLKNRLHERLRQKMTENTDHQLDSVATQIESFTTDIKARVESGLGTISNDIDAYTTGMHQKLQNLNDQAETWSERTEKAASIMREARLSWIRDGIMTLIAPMLAGALISSIIGVLVATMMLSQPSSLPISQAPALPVERVTGLGGLGQVLRHPPGSEVVPCPLRSASESVCVKLPRENQ